MWKIEIKRDGKTFTKTFASWLDMMEFHTKNGGRIL